MHPNAMLDVVGRSGRRYCSLDPGQRVGWEYGNKALLLVGNMPSELQRVGAVKAGPRAELVGQDSAWHQGEWGDHDEYIGESILGAGSRVLAVGVERGMGGWMSEVVAERRQGSSKLLAG